MIEGNVTKQEVVDMLLDLRHYVFTDVTCYSTEDVKSALSDVIFKIDDKLRELK